MKKKITRVVLVAFILASFQLAESQQPTKIPRIGRLFGGFLFTQTTRNESLLQGLRELGYVEGEKDCH